MCSFHLLCVYFDKEVLEQSEPVLQTERVVAETYRLYESIQVIYFECVWVHVVQVLKLFQQSLVIHSYICAGGK